MSQQTINTGTAPNTNTGDPIRTAFTKVNANFTDLYTGSAVAGNGGLLRACILGTFTFSSGATSATVSVTGMSATSNFKFFPQAGNTEAWTAWRQLQITSQSVSGNTCSVTLTLPSAPNTNLIYNYGVIL